MSEAHLPPLPPVPGVPDEEYEPAGRSMLELLDEDHAALRRLCNRAATEPAASDVLVATLARHLSAEEQYLYPAIHSVLPAGAAIAERELAADAELLLALRRLHTQADDKALRSVADHVRKHTHRTTTELFPALRERCTDSELVRLGNRVEIARSAAPTRPHPGTPSTPPLNKVVDPALGVVDKVMDALSRRTTWEEDL
ncbi:hemerythrin domain-containing protein [Dactylosporangium sp. NPDC051485]|uniref:hemerythrin domain-containing protein n=1 Tax=Dactylosporangium sp. NPDC051485 TaxID=3154846 RepID=UPI00342217A8